MDQEQRHTVQSTFASCFPKRVSLFTPATLLHELSPACPTTVYGNSHKCTRTIQGIINQRHLGKVLADYAWCLWFSMTESSCLEPHNAPRGTVNLADQCIDRWCSMHPAINMFQLNSFKCLLKNVDSNCLFPQTPVTIIQYLHPPIRPKPPPLPPPSFLCCCLE